MKPSANQSVPLAPLSTHWTELRLAAQAQNQGSPAARAAFHVFCQRYWSVVYEMIRTKRSEVAAHDLTQQFFLKHLIERDSLSRLDPARGSFRGWLWAALHNFLIDEYRHRTRQKDDERVRSSLESNPPLIAADAVRDYEYYYARNLAERSAAALHSRWAPKLARRGVSVDPGTLLWWLIERDADQVAERLNVQPDNARQVLRRLHVDLWKLLSAEVVQTVEDDSQAHDELVHICRVLGIEPPSLGSRAH
jgi:RNA polymerase sigma factor (sigma-70 family)